MGTIHQIQEGTAPRTAGRAQGPARQLVGAPAGEPAVPAPDTVPTIDPETARKFAQQVQEALDRVAPRPHEVVFRRDESTNGFVVEVRNPDGSVVRQYPPEKLLNLRRKLDELSGMVIDEMT